MINCDTQTGEPTSVLAEPSMADKKARTDVKQDTEAVAKNVAATAESGEMNAQPTGSRRSRRGAFKRMKDRLLCRSSDTVTEDQPSPATSTAVEEVVDTSTVSIDTPKKAKKRKKKASKKLLADKVAITGSSGSLTSAANETDESLLKDGTPGMTSASMPSEPTKAPSKRSLRRARKYAAKETEAATATKASPKMTTDVDKTGDTARRPRRTFLKKMKDNLLCRSKSEVEDSIGEVPITNAIKDETSSVVRQRKVNNKGKRACRLVVEKAPTTRSPSPVMSAAYQGDHRLEAIDATPRIVCYFECAICWGTRFSSKQECLQHFEEEHSNATWLCTKCNHEFSTNTQPHTCNARMDTFIRYNRQTGEKGEAAELALTRYLEWAEAEYCREVRIGPVGTPRRTRSTLSLEMQRDVPRIRLLLSTTSSSSLTSDSSSQLETVSLRSSHNLEMDPSHDSLQGCALADSNDDNLAGDARTIPSNNSLPRDALSAPSTDSVSEDDELEQPVISEEQPGPSGITTRHNDQEKPGPSRIDTGIYSPEQPGPSRVLTGTFGFTPRSCLRQRRRSLSNARPETPAQTGNEVQEQLLQTETAATELARVAAQALVAGDFFIEFERFEQWALNIAALRGMHVEQRISVRHTVPVIRRIQAQIFVSSMARDNEEYVVIHDDNTLRLEEITSHEEGAESGAYTTGQCVLL